MNERIAQPRRRVGWVTGERASNGKPISVNLAHVCAICEGWPQKRGEESLPTLCFTFPGADSEQQCADVLIRTEDLIAQLHEEGLG